MSMFYRDGYKRRYSKPTLIWYIGRYMWKHKRSTRREAELSYYEKYGRPGYRRNRRYDRW